MNVIHFEEIIYASTEKSAINGMSGFGIRAFSSGLTADEAQDIVNRASINYQVPMDKMVDMDMLQQNPAVVLDFAPVYTFRSVDLSNGERRWLLARTVYVGIDFGYFCNNPHAQRAGSNYLTDILVFKQEPTPAVLKAVAYSNLFQPKDRTCSPDNAEWQRLLTGEPPQTEGRDMDTDALQPTLDLQSQDLMWLAIALMQVFKNRQTGKPAQKIIFKAPERSTQRLVASIGLLPPALTEGLTLQTNYTQGYGVPDALQMVMVGEQNQEQMYEDQYVTIDLLTNTAPQNVEDNYLFDRLKEQWAAPDGITDKIFGLWTGMKHGDETDYAFAYQQMILAQTPQTLGLEQLDEPTLNKLGAIGGPDADTIWKKIERTLNDALQQSPDNAAFSDDVLKAFAALDTIQRVAPGRVKVEERSCEVLTEALFREDTHLGNILDDHPQALRKTLTMVEKAKRLIVSDEAFFSALHSSTNPQIWLSFIRLYIPNEQLQEKAQAVISNIIGSEFTDSKQLDMLTDLYPRQWLLSFQFTDADKTSQNEALNTLFAPLAQQELTAQTEALMLQKNAPAEEKVEQLLQSRFKPDAPTERYLHMLQLLAKGNYALPFVDQKLLSTALRWGVPRKYLASLFMSWISTEPQPQQLAAFIASKNIGVKETALVADRFWEELSDGYRRRYSREDYALAIIDLPKWDEQDMRDLMSQVTNKELRDYIGQQKGFMKQMMRKAISFFKNKK